MSVICTVYIPEGIVMAAESRLTGHKSALDQNGNIISTSNFTISDNSQKIILLGKTQVGISFCGNMYINDKTISDYLRIFEVEKIEANDSVEAVANKLDAYLTKPSQIIFFVCGYDEDVPYVYEVNDSGVFRYNGDGTEYNACWTGQKEAITKLMNAEPSMRMKWDWMPLKDGVDFAEFLIDTTIKYERFMDNIQTCGGPIDILVLTKDDAFWYKHKIYK